MPLFQHVMVGRRLLDLFASSDVDASAGFVKEGAPVNDELVRIARDDWASSRLMRDRRSPRKGKPGSSKARTGGRQVGNGRRVWIPSRVDVHRAARPRGPAARPSSSSSAGSAATPRSPSACRPTSGSPAPEERDEIFAFVEESCRHLPDDDLHVLGYHEFLDGLTRGVAAHHAGHAADLQAVRRGALRARAVQGRLRDRDAGAGHQHARPHGGHREARRSGTARPTPTSRRGSTPSSPAGPVAAGLDVEGHGVVLWQPGMNPREVAGLASTRTYPLRSSFRPSYNMAVNLVHQFGRERSRELLEQSFAQFQADKAVVGLARQLHKAEEALDGYAEAATCHLGDFMEYAALRRRISDVEKGAARERRQDRRDEAMESLGQAQARRRDHGADRQVLRLRRRHRPRAVRSRATALRRSPQDRQARRLAAMDFPTPVEAITRMRVPEVLQRPQPGDAARPRLGAAVQDPRLHPAAAAPRPAATRSPTRRSTARSPSCATGSRPTRATSAPSARTTPGGPSGGSSSSATPQTLKRRVEQRTNTVARTFDRVCDVLTALDYLDGDKVTERGQPPAAHLHRHGPRGRRVAARGPVGRPDALRAGGRAVRAGLRGAASRRRVLAAGAGRTDPERRSARWCGSGGSSTPWSATTSWTSCASPTSASPGRPTGGPRATTSTTCSTAPTWRPATSCAG